MNKKIINFIRDNDHRCLICSKTVDTVTVQINIHRGDNVITFSICPDCRQRLKWEVTE